MKPFKFDKMGIKKLFFMTIILLGTVNLVYSQKAKIQRPEIWGIAKMTYLVSNFKIAREYYGNFLGYGEPFSYNSELGKVISFKVNDHQFLEFIEDKDAREKNLLVSVSFETDQVDQRLGNLIACV
jgi:hypothetical protein